jgi:succinate dehydrogenase / fumarate reductase flavoprotein subunit
MQVIPVTAVHRGFGTTSRRDAWWATPLAVFVGLSAFVGYATWAAFQGDHYTYGPYLSPFYSPELFGDSPHAWFGPNPAAWPAWLPFSPALLILWAPASSASPATTTAAPTTRPSGPIRRVRGRRAAQDLPGENTRCPSSCRTRIATSCGWRSLFIAFLAYDVWLALWFTNAERRQEFGIGVGTIVLRSTSVLLGLLHLGCHVAPTRLVGGSTSCRSRRRAEGLRPASPASTGKHSSGRGAACWVGFSDLYVRLCSMGVLDRPEALVDGADFETHAYDVLVIGAGGAGLRAAIEAAASGVAVGLICKSLLGKAHTVMAEGGMAAAMGQRRRPRHWKVHFADTMRGGQYVNNWRMAELHAKEAPDRVRELEAWGAVFDRTQGRPHPPAQLRRAPLPAPRARRRPHRPRDDPHPAGSRHPPRHRPCTWSAHVIDLLKDGGRVAGALAYDRERGRFRVFKAAKRSSSPPAASAAPSRSRATHGSTPATAIAWPIGPAPTSSTWSSCSSIPPGWSGPRACAASSSPRACAAKAACCATATASASCSTTSPTTTRRRPRTTKKKAGATRRATRRPAARRSCSPATTSRAASMREVKAGRGSPHGGVFLDIAWIKEKLPNAAGAHQAQAAEHVPPVQGARGPRHHQDADGGRADDALHHGRHPRRRRLADVVGPGPVRRGRVRAGLHGANRLGGNSLSDLIVFGKRAGEYAAKFAKARQGKVARDRQGGRRCRDGPPWRPSTAQGWREPLPGAARPAGKHAGRWSASCATTSRDGGGARRHRGAARARGQGRRRRPPRVQPRLAHLPRPATTCSTCRRPSRGRRSSARRAAARTSARTIPTRTRTSAEVHPPCKRGKDGSMMLRVERDAAGAR